jgi:AraC family transcriptional regulator
MSRLRLDHAAAELVATDKALLAVALDAGFASHEVFTHAFLRRFGMSPRAYRARIAKRSLDTSRLLAPTKP